MKPDDALFVYADSEAALAVDVKWAVGAVFMVPRPFKLDAKQAFGKPDNLVDVVNRF
jgi:hypothetical protein